MDATGLHVTHKWMECFIYINRHTCRGPVLTSPVKMAGKNGTMRINRKVVMKFSLNEDVESAVTCRKLKAQRNNGTYTAVWPLINGWKVSRASACPSVAIPAVVVANPLSQHLVLWAFSQRVERPADTQPVVVVVNIINHKHLRFPKYAVHWVLRQAYKLS